MPPATNLSTPIETRVVPTARPCLRGYEPRPKITPTAHPRAPEIQLSFLERWLCKEIAAHWRHTGQPMTTRVLADLLQKNDRAVRRWLAALEQRGAIRRRGQRGGWLPALGAGGYTS